MLETFFPFYWTRTDKGRELNISPLQLIEQVKTLAKHRQYLLVYKVLTGSCKKKLWYTSKPGPIVWKVPVSPVNSLTAQIGYTKLPLFCTTWPSYCFCMWYRKYLNRPDTIVHDTTLLWTVNDTTFSGNWTSHPWALSHFIHFTH